MTSVLFVLNNFVKKSIYDKVQWSSVNADLIRELVEINSFEFDSRNIYHRIFSFRNQLTFIRSEGLAQSQPHFEDLVV